MLKRALPVVAAFVIVSAITAVLWIVKIDAVGPQHLVFFYLLPIALMAIVYGAFTAMLCAIFATGCAAFFLYDPVYSFAVSGAREVGELICFTALSLFFLKYTVELMRPVANFAPRNRAAHRPESSA